MVNEMHISFPGGKKVYADFAGMEIPTDQPVKEGGDGSAPQPFMLFLASIGTCAGIYVLGFCEKRNISTEGIRLVQKLENDAKGKLKKVTIEIVVPPEFPEKHINTLTRVADLCAVKKTILNPPEFETRTVVATS
ncbi:MAG: osmotically inducible protein OsmC [Deltaproteobacteria bacterium]|nr:osmotically inducible protein OsmC [Deltaproteobacteria bacterium]